MKTTISELSRNVSKPVEQRKGKSDISIGLSTPYYFMIIGLISRLLFEIPQELWPQRPRNQRILQVLEKIEGNISRTFSNRRLADMVSMSTNAFLRLFRQQVGTSPKDYIIRRRLEHSCFLLLYTEKSIDQIAEECGFCDRNYLTRRFKKVYNIGPGQYRKEGPYH